MLQVAENAKLELQTRLLIINDDPGIRETAAFLPNHGYVVDVADDGAGGRDERPIRLTGRSAGAVCRRVERGLRRHDDLPVERRYSHPRVAQHRQLFNNNIAVQLAQQTPVLTGEQSAVYTGTATIGLAR